MRPVETLEALTVIDDDDDDDDDDDAAAAAAAADDDDDIDAVDRLQSRVHRHACMTGLTALRDETQCARRQLNLNHRKLVPL